MKKQLFVRLSAFSLVALAVGALASSLSAGGGFECPDVYDPVICSNGVVYPNACYAAKAKARNCVPYGDD